MTENTNSQTEPQAPTGLIEWCDPPEVNPIDGWHGNLHIHAPPVAGKARKAPTFEHWPKLKHRPRKRRSLITDCCCCRMDPSETVSSGTFQDWYGWTWRHECAPGHGCDANPRRRFGMDLRRMWQEYG